MAISGNTKKSKLEFAEHNRNCCDYLSKVEDFPDWIITTAFYTAIHFVDAKIFPYEINQDGKKLVCQNVDQVRRFYYRGSRPKHDIRSNLVKERLKTVYPQFRALADASHCARYNDYSAYCYKDALLYSAYLNQIRAECIKP